MSPPITIAAKYVKTLGAIHRPRENRDNTPRKRTQPETTLHNNKPTWQKTENNLKTLLNEDLNIMGTKKKVASKLANCLLLTKYRGNGSKHNDIDQPLESIPREDIWRWSYTTCLCENNDTPLPTNSNSTSLSPLNCAHTTERSHTSLIRPWDASHAVWAKKSCNYTTIPACAIYVK